MMVLPCFNMFTLQFLGVNRAEFVILGVEGQGGQSLTHIYRRIRSYPVSYPTRHQISNLTCYLHHNHIV